MIPINYWAVLVGGVVNMILGGLWYGPFFGKPWMKMMGITPADVEAGKKKGMAKSYSLMFIGSLLMSWALAHGIFFAGTYLSLFTANVGIVVGFLSWLGFVAPVTISSVLWENKPWRLWILNASYYLVGLCLMGAIIGAWSPNLKPASNDSFDIGVASLNATYQIENQPVTLVNGSAGMTKVFGSPTFGDLNGDGKTDVAFLLTQDPGGSGTFFYVAAWISTGNGAQGTNAVLLGDRIAPQNIQIVNGQIIANYADRAPGEPMSATPSVGVSKYLTYNGSMLVASNPVVGIGEHCGGNMTTAPTCAAGSHCAPAPGSHLPFGDVGGVCVAN